MKVTFSDRDVVTAVPAVKRRGSFAEAERVAEEAGSLSAEEKIKSIEASEGSRNLMRGYEMQYTEHNRVINALATTLGDKEIAAKLIKPEYYETAKEALRGFYTLGRIIKEISESAPSDMQVGGLTDDDALEVKPLAEVLEKILCHYSAAVNRADSYKEQAEKAQKELWELTESLKKRREREEAEKEASSREAEHKAGGNVGRRLRVIKKAGAAIRNETGEYLSSDEFIRTGKYPRFLCTPDLIWQKDRKKAIRFPSVREAREKLDLFLMNLMGFRKAGTKIEELEFKGSVLARAAIDVKAGIALLPEEEAEVNRGFEKGKVND